MIMKDVFLGCEEKAGGVSARNGNAALYENAYYLDYQIIAFLTP